MNRENKRKAFTKNYYKTHACHDSFTCKVCGRLCTPQNAGSDHRNHCPNCLASLHVDDEPGDRARHAFGYVDFDYPAYIATFGARGGLRIERAA